jgi:tRNA(adenine34) deaminase
LSERTRVWESLIGVALDEARAALSTGDVPVGAVVVAPDGTLIATGRNEREATGDPTAHAEVVAIRAATAAINLRGQPAGPTADVRDGPAGRKAESGSAADAEPEVGSPEPASGSASGSASQPTTAVVQHEWRLEDCTLVVTLEPCVMCAGAIVAARVGRVVFGAWDPKAGAAGSVWDLVRDSRTNHRVEVIGSIREDECGSLLREFFAAHRRV